MSSPAVAIVVPVHNDEDWIATALDSCLAQTLSAIEVICVDDASTDSTRAIIEGYRERDSRITLIRSEVNRSAFQARRMGIEAATAPYVLFLDGDDQLAPDAAQATLTLAQAHGADIVGFGVDVIGRGGTPAPLFESSLQPLVGELSAPAIIPAIFPVGKVAQGHVWRYLYSRDLLRAAYADLPHDLALFRANDLPIAFLAIAHAKKYVSTQERFYRYYFGRGRSGQRVTDIDTFRFYLGAVDSIESIAGHVERMADRLDDEASAVLRASYESARLSTVAGLLRYCTVASPALRSECLALLSERVGEVDVIRAAATFHKVALPLLARRARRVGTSRQARSVLLTTNNLTTGGLQGAVAAQARYLAESGLRVIVAVHNLDNAVQQLPTGVRLVGIPGQTMADKLKAWLEICHTYQVDVIIDHNVLYNRIWPFYALAARTAEIPTIGWLHSFSLRPTYDFSTQTSFLRDNLPLLRTVVTLSREDVSFWKSLGLTDVVWLPNPPSPLLLTLPEQAAPKELTGGVINLVWWGRLQQRTKQVRDLILVAEHLRALGVSFHLTIIGPDTSDLSASQLREIAERRGVADAVRLPGPLHGQDLLDELAKADLLALTSAIEGNPLTVAEAQALGMPVVMYELPWVESIKDNGGVVAVPQGDTEALAREVARLSADPDRFRRTSQASLAATARARSTDFPALYKQLLADELPASFSPEPSLDAAALLLDRLLYYSERNAGVTQRSTDRLRKEARVQREHANSARQQAQKSRREADKFRREVRRLRGELRAVRNSITFKTGRVVAFLPRQVARLVPGLAKPARSVAANDHVTKSELSGAGTSSTDINSNVMSARPTPPTSSI